MGRIIPDVCVIRRNFRTGGHLRWLSVRRKPGRLQPDQPDGQANGLTILPARTSSFPWRILVIADSDRDLLNNDMVYRLAGPSGLPKLTDQTRQGSLGLGGMTGILPR